MPAKKNKYRYGKNISRICFENPPKITNKPIMKIINKQLDIKLEQFPQELYVILTKIKNRKAAGLDEMSPEVWKTRKFNDLLLQYCNTVYNQNTIERWTKSGILTFPQERWAQSPRTTTLVCRFLQGILFHVQSKDWANTTGIWSLQRNCHSHNDAL